MMPIQPPGAAVHVWYVQPQKVSEPLLAHYMSLLPAEERTRGQRYHFEKDRRLYVVSQALVRIVLSAYQGIAPTAWQFRKNPYGKPALIPQSGMAPLSFNLSHTDGLVACAVTLERAIGVDVEHLDRAGLSMAVARNYFAPVEISYLETLSTELQRQALFVLWTLKEAYVKARGLGLSLSLDSFAFTLDPLSITFTAPLEDNPQHWQFACHSPTHWHILSIAVQRRGADLPIIFREIIPLVTDLDIALKQ